MEYYNQQVVFIINAVVAGLQRNSSRKFSYVEQAFFQYWYETQNVTTQNIVKGLVANGQLTFLNGGWSMHDEANPTYVDMLDNTATGQRAILNNFGQSALPTVTWQIDPFGHSAFQGILSSPLSGYKGVMWAREMDDFKMLMCAARGLERVWSPSASLGADATTFQGIFVDAGYGSPGEARRCDGKKPGDSGCVYSNGKVDIKTIISDVEQFRTPNIRDVNNTVDIILNFGDDFLWENAPDWFNYLDGVIDAFNSDASGRFHAFYSTPAIYMASKLKNTPMALQPYAGDFFPYNDDSAGHNLWTGYFTSRPAFKGLVRESSAVLQSARQLQALVGGVSDLGPTNPLFRLERAMGVTQHHDSVAGTAKEYVNKDYAVILEGGRADAYASIAASLSALTGYKGAPFALCPLANATLCPALESGAPAVVIAYNALGQNLTGSGIRVAAGFPTGVASYNVMDSTGKPVTAQIIPLSARDIALRALYGGSSANVMWIAFTGDIPAAGFAAFFLVPSATTAEAPHTHESLLKTVGPTDGDSTVTNGRVTLTVSAATGLLAGYADAVTGVSLPLQQEWLSYISFDGKSSLNGSKQASGAYMFRPLTETPTALQSAAASVILVTGPVVNESQHTYAYVSQSSRLWAGAANAEIEWTVGPVDVSDGQGHEVITRYSSGLATNAAWTTDSNCREYQKRVRNFRPQWPIKPSEAVSSNYYPVNCLIKASSPSATFAVAVDRSEGGSSMNDGQLELMVHRRILHDDGRGVGEPLNEPGLDGKGLIIRGRHWIVASPADSAPAAYKALHSVGLSLPRTVTAFSDLGSLTPDQWLASYTPTASLLAKPLPENVHLVTAHAQGNGKFLLRLAHTYEVGEDPVLSADVTIDLATLLGGALSITSAVDMTLPGTQPLSAVSPTTYLADGGSPITVPRLPPAPSGSGLTITLKAQQIRTFLCTLG